MSGRKLLIGAGYVLAAIVLWYVLGREPEPAPISYELAPAAEIASRSRIEKALDKQVALHLKQIPLDQALKQISDKVGVPIRLDVRSLEDASIRVDGPVTVDVSGISLRSALYTFLNPIDLTWTLRNDAVTVTTPETDLDYEFIVVVYPVRDLVMVRTAGGTSFEYHQLVELISESISPTTWNKVGGPASINADPAVGAIVVEQIRPTQKQIELLLVALRQARDAQGIRPGQTITSTANRPLSPQAMGAAPNPAALPVKPQPGSTGPAANAGPPSNGAVPNVSAPK